MRKQITLKNLSVDPGSQFDDYIWKTLLASANAKDGGNLTLYIHTHYYPKHEKNPKGSCAVMFVVTHKRSGRIYCFYDLESAIDKFNKL